MGNLYLIYACCVYKQKFRHPVIISIATSLITGLRFEVWCVWLCLYFRKLCWDTLIIVRFWNKYMSAKISRSGLFVINWYWLSPWPLILMNIWWLLYCYWILALSGHTSKIPLCLAKWVTYTCCVDKCFRWYFWNYVETHGSL